MRDTRAMSEDLVVIRQVLPAPAASDYETIFAALMQTERGRWFLQEYAQRNRSADTKLLLSAIERIESAVCVDRSAQPRHDLRADLMEMAEAITKTRAEVAEIKAEASTSARQPPPRLPPSGDVFAAAERIRDVAWAMRGHGFDPSTCEQIEELAGTILSASALRDPADRRTRRLGEVLQYLEQRIANLIDSCAEGEAPAARSDDPALPEREPLEDEAAPGAMADNGSDSAGVLVTNGWASDGARDEGPSPQIRIADFLKSNRADDAAPPAPVATLEPAIAVKPAPPALPIEAEVAIVAFSAELASLDPTPPPEPPPPPPAAQRSADDPLAPLKAMSADELIALFS